MKCLLKYEWVKLPRNTLPQGKGLMGCWARLASRAAFRSGKAKYCGYINDVSLGSWTGGIVGLKSILGIKNRQKALEVMDKLSALGYISYSLDAQTKKFSYTILDWVVKCSGEACMEGAIYATEGYGFLCLPRNITNRLAENGYKFEDSDAWLDLWCHTVWQDPRNAFSNMAPVVQFGQYGAALTLENLGQRWNWEKTKVWRFLHKYADAFTLHKLPGSYGCLVFNAQYPTGSEYKIPTQGQVMRILGEMRIQGNCAYSKGSDNERINKAIAWYSKNINPSVYEEFEEATKKNRVALSVPIIRAYLSLKSCENCYDCKSNSYSYSTDFSKNHIRGPCQNQIFRRQGYE